MFVGPGGRPSLQEQDLPCRPPQNQDRPEVRE